MMRLNDGDIACKTPSRIPTSGGLPSVIVAEPQARIAPTPRPAERPASLNIPVHNGTSRVSREAYIGLELLS